MFELVVQHEIDAGHRLREHKGMCRNVHGHHYVFKVYLRSRTLDEQGFVVDFKVVKDSLKRFLDEHFDHAFLFEEGDPIGEYIASQGFKVYRLPYPPTAENLALTVYQHLTQTLTLKGVDIVKVECWETPTSGASVVSEQIEWTKSS